ncbi:MAG TPA: rhodanese-like domain-containing protein [Burkholderiales bacterium]|nr:rhodanese-like domain-containing protein [Burkholderiales bacterium]
MEFIRNNLLLIAVAVVSGVMLIWPLLRRSAGGPHVDPAGATQLINREDALVIDVREPGEFGAGHILGARNVPLGTVGSRTDIAKKKDRPLIVYCDSGGRASKAAATLREQGYTRVVSLSGGLGAWQSAGLPVER